MSPFLRLLANVAAGIATQIGRDRFDGGIGEVALLVQVLGRIGLGHAFKGVEEVESFRRHLVAQDCQYHGRRAALVDAAFPHVAVDVDGLFQERVKYVAAVGGDERSRSGPFVVTLEFARCEPGRKERAVNSDIGSGHNVDFYLTQIV